MQRATRLGKSLAAGMQLFIKIEGQQAWARRWALRSAGRQEEEPYSFHGVPVRLNMALQYQRAPITISTVWPISDISNSWCGG